MRNFQNTFEACKRSFIRVFFNLHDCTFDVKYHINSPLEKKKQKGEREKNLELLSTSHLSQDILTGLGLILFWLHQKFGLYPSLSCQHDLMVPYKGSYIKYVGGGTVGFLWRPWNILGICWWAMKYFSKFLMSHKIFSYVLFS